MVVKVVDDCVVAAENVVGFVVDVAVVGTISCTFKPGGTLGFTGRPAIGTTPSFAAGVVEVDPNFVVLCVAVVEGTADEFDAP